jgi:hypothetical protein
MKSAIFFPADKELHINHLVRKILLTCGILSSIIYIAGDITAALQWGQYDFSSQGVSELAAWEAPTRSFMVKIFLIYNFLVVAFSAGILITHNSSFTLRITGILILLYAIDGLAGFLLFPVHSRGVDETMAATSTMHIIITAAEVLFILLSVGFGAFADGKVFRKFSIIILLMVAFFGFWAGMDIPKIMADLPTPWLGVKERVNIYGYMLWLLVLSVTLLKKK